MGNIAFRQYNDSEVIDNIQRSYFRPQEIKVIQNYLDPYKNPARESTEEKLRGLSKQSQTAQYVRGTILIGAYALVIHGKYVPPQLKKFFHYNKQGQESTVLYRNVKEFLIVELGTIIAMMPLNFYILNQYTEIQVEREKIDADYFKQIGPVESQVIKDYGKILDNEYQFRKEMLTSNFTRPEEYLNSDLNIIKKAYFTVILEQSSKIRSHQPIVTQIVNNVLNQSPETNQGEIGPEKRLRTFAEIEADKERKSRLGDIKQYEQDNLKSKGWFEKSSVEDKTEYKYVDPYEARKGKKRWD